MDQTNVSQLGEKIVYLASGSRSRLFCGKAKQFFRDYDVRAIVLFCEQSKELFCKRSDELFCERSNELFCERVVQRIVL